MSTLSEKLSARKFPQRDVTICLNGELSLRRDEAMAEMVRALQAEKEGRATDARLGQSPSAAAQRKVDEIEKEMRDESVTLRFTGVPFGEYNKFIIQNPPRKGNQIDLASGFNTQAFFMFVARRTGVHVDEQGRENEVTEAEWDAIELALTDGDHDRIAEAIITVNRREGQRGVDFLSPVSERTPDFSETSESPATGE
ncbi:hypothetical protein ACF1AJ_20435 [Leifsonia sp. NPDC014704]|uniref:hypothetical protein n=1 Tax=Leifsonia sp. NPDC014704 TaxID=3364123 RepID=UPI0036F47BD0